VFEHAWVESAVCSEPGDTERPLQHLLDEAVERWPARPAVEFMRKLISYRELGALVDHAAAGLQKLGVGPGVPVALHLPITPHVPIAFFAVLKAGGTLVDCSTLTGEAALCSALESSRSEVLITLAAHDWYEPIRQSLQTAHLKRIVVGTRAQFAAQPDALIAEQRERGEQVEVPVDGRHIRFGQLLRNDGRLAAQPIELRDRAVAVLRYAGGDGEVLTHAALSATVKQSVKQCADAACRADSMLAGSEPDSRAAAPLSDARTLLTDMLLCVQLGALQRLGGNNDRLVLHPMVAAHNYRSN